MNQAILDSGIVPQLKKLVFHHRNIIRREACLILSNIAAGTDIQTEYLIMNDFVNILGHVIKNDQEDVKIIYIQVQKEAIFALANLTTVEKPNIAKFIFDEDILDYICFALKSSKNDVLLVALEALNRLLEYGNLYFRDENGQNPVVLKILKTKYVERLEELQLSKSNKIYDLSNKIIENFFDNENAN